MNMPITTTPALSAAVATAGGTTSSVPGVSGGFAGALVQAIVGGSQAPTVTGGISLPVGLVGLLGLLEVESTEVNSEDLLAMIAKLAEQLDQLDTDKTLPKEDEIQLTTLLEALQGLLQQIELTKPVVKLEQQEASTPIIINQVIIPTTPKPVVQVLRETLEQLTAVLVNGQEDNQVSSAFLNQLKTLLDKISIQPLVHSSGQVTTEQSGVAVNASKTTKANEHAEVVAKDPSIQAEIVVQEPRRAVQAMRDPIWRLNLVETSEKTTEGQLAVVPTVVAAEEVSDSESQHAWTMLRSESATPVEANLVKAPLPAQVPVQQFAQQIEKFLVKQFLLTQGNGTTEAKITLNPEHLGQVDIRIMMQNGIVTAQFIAESGMARELLDNQMSQLRSALQGQGLQVDRLEVVQQSSASSNASFLHQEQRQPNSGNGNGSNGRGKNGLYEDPALFAAELERSSSLKEFGYGSSINVTA